jgi:hypothetical protein
MKLWTVDARGEALKHLEGRSEGSTPRARDLEWSDPLPLFASAVARGLAVEAGDAETQVFRIVDVCWESSTLRQRWRAEVANLHPGYARVLANLLRAPGCDAIMVTETDGTDGHSRPLDLAVPYPRAPRSQAPEFRYSPPEPQAILRQRSLRLAIGSAALDPAELVPDLDLWSELVCRSGFAPSGRDPRDAGTFPAGAYVSDRMSVAVDFEGIFLVDEAAFESPLRWAQRLLTRGLAITSLEVA